MKDDNGETAEQSPNMNQILPFLVGANWHRTPPGGRSGTTSPLPLRIWPSPAAVTGRAAGKLRIESWPFPPSSIPSPKVLPHLSAAGVLPVWLSQLWPPMSAGQNTAGPVLNILASVSTRWIKRTEGKNILGSCVLDYLFGRRGRYEKKASYS